ncbi:MAG: glucuronate isomerase [Cyclobacteriaceae bacterium]
MKTFLDQDFLLHSETAKLLYHDYAAQMPIIDYHNHLPPQEIAENRHFKNITEGWLEGDHYKWRAMRANGIDESFITGKASDEEKFQKWADTVPYTVRNPLYHWTHLELQRYFNINDLLNSNTASAIYEQTKSQLASAGCQELLSTMNVKVVCTTDDPADNLEYHAQIKASGLGMKVLPTFRPDKALAIDNPESYLGYLKKLEAASGKNIASLDDLLNVLNDRMDFFHEMGGRLSDLGFNTIPAINDTFNHDVNFKAVLSGKQLDITESEALRAHMLLEICKGYHQRGWTQQFHLGALRNTNARALRELGPDTGYDSIGDFSQAATLAAFLNKLDNTDQLSKTVLYNLNPADNEVFATMVGNYNDGRTIGKMQFGSGWWYLDQKHGMEAQMNTLSNMGLLSHFVGMLTDSRSFLSFPRHEYFRRILCNLIGTDVENGELPNDMTLLGKMVQDISYNNAKNYFGFEK